MIKKLKKASGFTLAETLMTVLILLMVSTVVATGIPAAVNAYAKAVDAANAHALLSTTINALRDEFSTAWDMKCPEKTEGVKNKIVSYYSSDTGARTKLYIGKAKDTDTEETIMVQDYLAFDTDPFKDDAAVQNSEVNKPHTLVSTSAVTKNMKVSYDSVELIDNADNAVVIFKDLKVTSTKNNTVIAKIDELNIRLLSTNLVIPEAAGT